MKNLLFAGRALAYDMASTVFFLVLFLVTKNLYLSVALGMALGVIQIGAQFLRKKPIDTMQWMSLFLIIGSGTATFIAHDPRFIMAKPTIIYVVVGVVMLKRGWMLRYMPPIALETAGDMALTYVYVWSALMFASAILNLVLVFTLDPLTWSAAMSVWGIASKLTLFLVQFANMRIVGGRRRRAKLQGLGAGEAAAAAG